MTTEHFMMECSENQQNYLLIKCLVRLWVARPYIVLGFSPCRKGKVNPVAYPKTEFGSTRDVHLLDLEELLECPFEELYARCTATERERVLLECLLQDPDAHNLAARTYFAKPAEQSEDTSQRGHNIPDQALYKYFRSFVSILMAKDAE
jgi:hypothetical protein